MKKLLTIITAGLLVTNSSAQTTNYEARLNAAADMQKTFSAVEVAREQRLTAEANAKAKQAEALAALAGQLTKDQALTAYVANTFAGLFEKVQNQQTTQIQQQAPVVQLPNIPEECNFGCQLGKGVAGLFGITERLAPVVLAGYQSKNQLTGMLAQTLANKDIQVNAQNTNASMFANAGQTNALIATNGFTANTNIANNIAGVAGAFAARPSVVVNNTGNQNAVALFESTASVTAPTTVTCPSSSTGTSTSGNTTAGVGTGGGAPGSGAPGGAGGNTGNPNANPSAVTNCPVTK